MNHGWIKLWRKLQDNSLWQRKPYSYGQAWVDLLLLANHKPSRVWLRGIPLDLEVGQLGYSKESLAAKWGWSRGKVTRFLDALENEQQIVQQTDNVTTVITITNWEADQKTTRKQRSRRTASDQQADTDKNEKNEENEKKSSCNAEALRLSELFLELIVQRKGDLRRPNLDRWARDMDRLIRLDGRTPERIEAVIRFCQRDPFWQNNILSVAALRRQFDRLELLMQQRRPAESTAEIVARLKREGRL
jgi:hypothetical protein